MTSEMLTEAPPSFLMEQKHIGILSSPSKKIFAPPVFRQADKPGGTDFLHESDMNGRKQAVTIENERSREAAATAVDFHTRIPGIAADKNPKQYDLTYRLTGMRQR